MKVRLSGRTRLELEYDDPHRDYDTAGFGDFIRSLRRWRWGKGYSFTGETDDAEIIRRLLADMECRIGLQGGSNGIDYEGSASVAAAVRKDFIRLLNTAKEAGFNVTEWEQ